MKLHTINNKKYCLRPLALLHETAPNLIRTYNWSLSILTPVDSTTVKVLNLYTPCHWYAFDASKAKELVVEREKTITDEKFHSLCADQSAKWITYKMPNALVAFLNSGLNKRNLPPYNGPTIVNNWKEIRAELERKRLEKLALAGG